MTGLPLLEPAGGRPERADAARNRRRILAAAADLVRERGIDAVSMDDVACAAGVGAGTLYRRFGDRQGLAYALLDEHARALQDDLISGPPPLGPGAPAHARLEAFGDAYLDFLDRHGELLATARGREGGLGAPEAVWLLHLTVLLREAAPDLDADYGARALFAALHPGLHLHARRGLGWELERLRRGWRQVVGALAAQPTSKATNR